MLITSVRLKNYRNYADETLIPGQGVTALVGDNAQGKTNAIESIYLCCTGRSHRTSHDRELIRVGEDIAYVKLSCMRRDGRHDIEISINQTGRRQIKVNGSQISRSGELLGHVTGVMFAPEDLRMVKDAPMVRRRFMDMELSQLSQAYYYTLQRYNRALKQRNALIKEIAIEKASASQLADWDRELALSGGEIMANRRQFVDEISQSVVGIHSAISGGRERISTKYEPNVSAGEDAQENAENIAKALSESRDKDIRRGTTSYGPHHDDIGIFIDDMDARSYASQGQVRTCALSLKLSEIDLLSSKTGETPVLMLDDVMSELDPDRRRQLISRLEGVQTIITCTDKNDLASAVIGKLIRVSGARLEEET